MTTAPDLGPIFVHASPRGGSTYFFNVLRRNASLMCFEEPLSDVFGYWGKKGTAQFKERLKWDANHSFLERDDFAEIIEAWDTVMPLYPPCLPYRNYLPPGGVLSPDLRAYLAALIEYAQSRGKRPTLCEVYSRGRVGALRDVFSGFHVAQYRDPLSQFGSFFRPLPDAGEWHFLMFPLMELGLNGDHPLYNVIPEAWRVPVFPWPDNDKAQRWATSTHYNAIAAAPRSDTIEKLFRWHLFSWVLTNLAALSYSDFILDIDKAHDDASYRQSVADVFRSTCGIDLDFSDLKKFSRYYEFEGVDVAAVCDQVETVITRALQDGRLERAVLTLGRQPPTVHIQKALEMLFAKIHASLSTMAVSGDRRYVTKENWRIIAGKHRLISFNPLARKVAQRAHPFVSPILRAARRAGFLH